MSKPTRSDGALAGLLIVLPLAALFAAAHALFQFPFLPFDLFDWLARTLPGGIVTFGIDVIVALIAAFNLENTSSTAKTAEQILALILFVALGYGCGVLFFAWARRGQERDTLTRGTQIGLAFGILMALISLSVSEASGFTLMLHLAWIVALCGGAGLLLGWLHQRFAALPSEALVAQPERRQFLVRVGGSAAVLTVFGAGVSVALNRGEGQASAQPWSATNPLPNADAVLQPAPGTRAEFTPVRDHYRIDINSLPPVVREADWKLQVTGLVEKPLALPLEDLRTQFDSLDHFVTLSCISNPVGGDLIGTQRW
ncbi:MAG: molybdopterin-dependent oxidoreductase, partial [Anaerolineae bacterium]|nr:molybdopterin-dependent oxidoreductase [Anaerolineae bacterium]